MDAVVRGFVSTLCTVTRLLAQEDLMNQVRMIRVQQERPHKRVAGGRGCVSRGTDRFAGEGRLFSLSSVELVDVAVRQRLTGGALAQVLEPGTEVEMGSTLAELIECETHQDLSADIKFNVASAFETAEMCKLTFAPHVAICANNATRDQVALKEDYCGGERSLQVNLSPCLPL